MSGIYGIYVNNTLVYIGKANDIESRRKQHWCKIFQPTENKYWMLHAALEQHCRIEFKVLEDVPLISRLLDVEEMWIKAARPCLNSKHNFDRGRKISSQEFFEEVL